MISRSLFALVALSLYFAGSPSASAQSNVTSWVEGHVFDSKTLRPLQRANVSLVGFVGACVSSFTGETTDGGGFYRTAMADPELANFDVIELVVQCTLKKSRKRVTYTTQFYNPMVGGRVYTRDLYIKVPDGDTGCIQAPLSLPDHPTNVTGQCP